MTRPLAVVTGASSGIGFAFAKLLATEGYDLVLAADDARKLQNARLHIADRRGIDVTNVAVDLSRPDGPQTLYDETAKLRRPVDILIDNAGIGVWGDFSETGLSDEMAMIGLNICAVVSLAKLFGRDMIARGAGRILITASEAAVAPTALAAVYAGTKAFDHAFAQALREEWKDKGVTVTALMPGPTDTNWFQRAGAAHTETAQGKLADPARIARDGYDALMKGADHVVTPMKNKLVIAAMKLAPERAKVQRLD